MTKPRKNAPALYELIGTRSRLSPPGPPGPPGPAEEEAEFHHHEEDALDEEQPRSILGPGRTVRMPVGYFFFGVAIIIAIGVGAYVLGFKARDRAYERHQRAQAQAEVPSEPLDDLARNLPVNESLLAGGQRPPGSSSGARGDTAPVSVPSGAIGAGRGHVVIVEGGTPDPRVRDSNYAIVASLGRDRAEDLAGFLADRGLDVAVVKLNNARLHSVIPLRGFPRGTYGSDERKRFEEALRDLGDEYEALGGRRKSFDDLYWDKY